MQNHALVLETANRVALDILANRTGVEALRHIAEAARVLSHARYAALGIARADGQGLSEFITTGLTPEEEAQIGARPQGVGILGLLLSRSEPLRIDDLSRHPDTAGFPANHPPMLSLLGVPIRRGEIILGSLYLTDKEDGSAFTAEDEAAVQALGAHAAVAIYNLRMVAHQRALISSMITAQEEERRAVAHNLHDGLTQYVMAAHAHIESCKRATESGKQERAQLELEQGLSYLKDAVVESRRMVNSLRLLALEDLGLAGALEHLVQEEKSRAGWKEGDFLHNIPGKRYLKALETAIYRITQEALNNARKHAQTDRVSVILLERQISDTHRAVLTLEVRDWGQGFVPGEKAGNTDHLGIQGMIERVSLMDGTCCVQSAPGAGTTVQAVFPALEPQEDEIQGGKE